MTWVKIHENAPTHTKFLLAGVDALGWWVSALAYCNRELTDGFISARALPLVFAGLPRERTLEIVEVLVRERLLHKVEEGQRSSCSHTTTCPRRKARESGYYLHDFFEFQPAKQDVVERGRIKAMAGRKGGEANAKRYKQDAQQDASLSASPLLSLRSGPFRTAPKEQEDPEGSSAHAPREPDKHGPRRLVDHHAEQFKQKTGQPMVLNYAKECKRVKPIIDAHGIEKALELNRQFFMSDTGWWVRKNAWHLGVFASSVNDLVAANGAHDSRRISDKWAGRKGGPTQL